MAKKRMGFDGRFYYGTAGSTAATYTTEVKDVSYSLEIDEADVSDRSSIYDLVDVAGVKFSIDITIDNKDSSAFVAALRAAAIAGTAISVLTADKAGGFGVDCDVVVKLGEEQKLRDAQRITISLMPTNQADREPTWGTQSSTTTTAAP